jgi:hypothetical protein
LETKGHFCPILLYRPACSGISHIHSPSQAEPMDSPQSHCAWFPHPAAISEGLRISVRVALSLCLHQTPCHQPHSQVKTRAAQEFCLCTAKQMLYLELPTTSSWSPLRCHNVLTPMVAKIQLEISILVRSKQVRERKVLSFVFFFSFFLCLFMTGQAIDLSV